MSMKGILIRLTLATVLGLISIVACQAATAPLPVPKNYQSQLFGQFDTADPVLNSIANNGGYDGVAIEMNGKAGNLAGRRGVLTSAKGARPEVAVLASRGIEKPLCVEFTNGNPIIPDCTAAPIGSYDEIDALGDGVTMPVVAIESDVAVRSMPTTWDNVVSFGFGMGTFLLVDRAIGMFSPPNAVPAEEMALAKNAVERCAKVDQVLINKWLKEGKISRFEADDLVVAKTTRDVEAILGGARAHHLLVEMAARKRGWGLVMIRGGNIGFNGSDIPIFNRGGEKIGQLIRGTNTSEWADTYLFWGRAQFKIGANNANFGGTPDKIIVYGLPAMDGANMGRGMSCFDPCASQYAGLLQRAASDQSVLQQQLNALNSKLDEALRVQMPQASPMTIAYVRDNSLAAANMTYANAAQTDPLYQAFRAAYQKMMATRTPEADAATKKAWENWQVRSQQVVKPQVADTVTREIGQPASRDVIDGEFRVIEKKASKPTFPQPAAVVASDGKAIPLLTTGTSTPTQMAVDAWLKQKRVPAEMIPVASVKSAPAPLKAAPIPRTK